MHILTISKNNTNKEQNAIPFKRKLTLQRYGEIGKTIKELLENSPKCQKNSENTILGLAMIGLATLGEAGIQLNDLRKRVSDELANMKLNIRREESLKTKEKKENALRELLTEMTECGMTQEEISANLGCSPSNISKLMKKRNIKTAFAKKYDTELTEVRDSSPVLKKAIGDNSAREYYLEILKDYPQLNSKYKHLLVANYKKPDNVDISNTLINFESIMYALSKPDEIKYHKEYFEALNTKYINDFENICKACGQNINNGGSMWRYLTLIKGEKISSEQLEDWVKYPEFNCDEYMTLRDFSSEDKKNLSEFKRQSGIVYFDIDKLNKDDEDLRYSYFIKYSDNQSIQEKLLNIAKLHETLYKEPAYFYSKKPAKYEPINIRDELFIMLKRDKELDSIYSMTKFLGFDENKKYDYKYDDIVKMQKGTLEYDNLKNNIANWLFNLDMNSEKVQQLVNIVNRNDLFDDIMDGSHAILRFVSRFVLKDDTNPKNFENKVEEKATLLREVLEKSINENRKITLCKVPSGTAPQFYLAKSELGSFVSITIGRDGKIHTIYEDKYKYEDSLKFKENVFCKK